LQEIVALSDDDDDDDKSSIACAGRGRGEQFIEPLILDLTNDGGPVDQLPEEFVCFAGGSKRNQYTNDQKRSLLKAVLVHGSAWKDIELSFYPGLRRIRANCLKGMWKSMNDSFKNDQGRRLGCLGLLDLYCKWKCCVFVSGSLSDVSVFPLQ